MRVRLDELLVARGLAASRSLAQRLVREGKVRVAGKANPKPGNPVPEDAEIEVEAPERFVSRGGWKLEGAFETFGLDVEGLDCLDVGASTGGFTDCMLQHGAARVAALDVGHGQLHPKMLADPRVLSREGFNCRALSPEDLPFVPRFAACDVSFISLRLILPPMARVVAPGSFLVTLVKPQFEAGRDEVGRGGVVRDQKVRDRVLQGIRAFGTGELGLEWAGVRESPIRGAAGNIEYTALWRKPDDKKSLRRAARAMREAHAAEAPVSALAALRETPEWNAARTVLLYLPAPGGGEPDTADLVADARARGVRVAVPAWVPDGAFDACAWPPPGQYAPALLSEEVGLSAGPMGIAEPEEKVWIRPEEIDLWIVPGLLFDASGTRLGHGKGWIDRLLAGRRPDAAAFGLAFPWQVWSSPLPREPHDRPVDRLVLAGAPDRAR